MCIDCVCGNIRSITLTNAGGGYKKDSNSFIFALNNGLYQEYEVVNDSRYAVNDHGNYMLLLGGYCLYVRDQCNANSYSYVNYRVSHCLPSGLNLFGSAGKTNFQVKEITVYTLQ